MTALSTTLSDQGFATDATIHANLSSEQLTQAALDRGEGKRAKHGPLVVETGKHTGRSAKSATAKPKIPSGGTITPP